MYKCSICQKDVVPNENGGLRCCDNAKILAEMSAVAIGRGGMKEEESNMGKEVAHFLIKAVSVALSLEVFINGKKELFIRNFKIIDDETRREFVLNLTVKEND